MKKSIVLGFILLFAVASVFAQEQGMKKKRPRPNDYGKVVLNNSSQKNNISPVVFDHWLHRSKFTCRLCHVDIGFGMKTGTTGITASDNMNGSYCGTCHNGKMVVDSKVIFKACGKEAQGSACNRCHSYGKEIKKEYDFAAYTANLPKERFGNGINWEKAEKDGQLKLIDYIEGISIKRQKMPLPKDFALDTQVEGLPSIIFSHKKHAVWNGCEVCHPEIFAGVKKGATKYTMIEIFDNKYCGVCHGTVAFPNLDCQRCHTEPAS